MIQLHHKTGILLFHRTKVRKNKDKPTYKSTFFISHMYWEFLRAPTPFYHLLILIKIKKGKDATIDEISVNLHRHKQTINITLCISHLYIQCIGNEWGK